MDNRFLSLLACLMLLLLHFPSAQAGEEIGTPEQRADWELQLNKAASMDAEAKSSKMNAARVRAEKDAECQKRFQVNACLKENQTEYRSVAHQAKGLASEARAIEQAVRQEQLKEKDALNQAASARRQAELAERKAATAAARQAAASRQANIRADKERQAEAGMRRKAAEAEKLRQRQAAHQARIAKKMKAAQERPETSGSDGR